MAEPDDLTRLLIQSQNVLGTPVTVPFQGQGDLAAGASPGLPTAVTGSPSGGAAGGRAFGGGGGGGISLPDLRRLFSGQGNLGTRGDTGGTSLSDFLRSLPAGAAGGGTDLGARGLFGGEFAGTPLLPGSTVIPGTDQPVIGSLGGSLADVLRDPSVANLATSGTAGASAAPGAVEGAAGSGAGGALGGVGAGAGAAAAVLGLIAQATGNQDLAKAAQSLGAAGSAAGTADAVATAVPAGVAGAAVPATAAVGAAAAPVAAMTLGWSIANMLNPGSAPDVGDLFTGGRPDPYQTFVPTLMGNESSQGQALNSLSQALPYVQSKEELGQLLNTYRNYVQTTTGIPLEDTGGVYGLSTIPGVGPVTHGQQTTPVDWGPTTQGLQTVINQLAQQLPGQAISDSTGLSGEAGMRLWSQFLDREKVAPTYVPQDVAPSVLGQVGEGGGQQLPGVTRGFYGAGDLARAGGQDTTGALTYGQPGYDYAGSGFPAPGQYVGSISPTWQNLVASLGGQAGPAPSTALPASPLDSVAAAALATPPGDFAGGLLPEEQRKRLLA